MCWSLAIRGYDANVYGNKRAVFKLNLTLSYLLPSMTFAKSIDVVLSINKSPLGKGELSKLF